MQRDRQADDADRDELVGHAARIQLIRASTSPPWRLTGSARSMSSAPRKASRSGSASKAGGESARTSHQTVFPLPAADVPHAEASEPMSPSPRPVVASTAYPRPRGLRALPSDPAMRNEPSPRYSRPRVYGVDACSTALVVSSVTSSVAVQAKSSMPHDSSISQTKRRASPTVATSGEY